MDDRVSFCILGTLLVAAAAALLPAIAPASAGGAPCAAPEWSQDPVGEVVFDGVQALDPALAGDGPHTAEAVSLEPDVLGVGRPVTAKSGAGLSLTSPVICVRYRPEWLGLTVANEGSSRVQARLAIDQREGTALIAELPPLAPGETRRILLRASTPIAEAEGLELRFLPDR